MCIIWGGGTTRQANAPLGGVSNDIRMGRGCCSGTLTSVGPLDVGAPQGAMKALNDSMSGNVGSGPGAGCDRRGGVGEVKWNGVEVRREVDEEMVRTVEEGRGKNGGGHGLNPFPSSLRMSGEGVVSQLEEKESAPPPTPSRGWERKGMGGRAKGPENPSLWCATPPTLLIEPWPKDEGPLGATPSLPEWGWGRRGGGRGFGLLSFYTGEMYGCGRHIPPCGIFPPEQRRRVQDSRRIRRIPHSESPKLRTYKKSPPRSCCNYGECAGVTGQHCAGESAHRTVDGMESYGVMDLRG